MNKEQLRIAFLGTPEFALPSFKMLIEEGYSVAAVFTQPDRPKGRGHKMIPPPVKVLAEEHGIPVYQFERISRDGVETLREVAPDLMITVAFGQILSREVLAIPSMGCINVHGSLLPAYRGAAPIEMAVINGEAQAGITTMYTVYELDAGDMLEKDAVDILPGETGGQLRERLSLLGAGTLKRTLNKLLDGTLAATPQNEAEATYYPMF
ncbi:MAG: methionyl-tRNA formyltransferase, partial [Christensenellaceae bacterium]|nr:methionyl-tRNA formyltransferase [Christensenellaceae bacterium]